MEQNAAEEEMLRELQNQRHLRSIFSDKKRKSCTNCKRDISTPFRPYNRYNCLSCDGAWCWDCWMLETKSFLSKWGFPRPDPKQCKGCREKHGYWRPNLNYIDNLEKRKTKDMITTSI
jgi:hypothetical protein